LDPQVAEPVNGHQVLPAFKSYWQKHAEIGLPRSDPLPDGSQLFENARLACKNNRVVTKWLGSVSVSIPTI
jgi:hypothetical protein